MKLGKTKNPEKNLQVLTSFPESTESIIITGRSLAGKAEVGYIFFQAKL